MFNFIRVSAIAGLLATAGLTAALADQVFGTPGYMSGYVPQASPVCGPNGCSWNGTGTPVLSGTCVTGGGGTSAIVGNNFSGRVSCTSSVNTAATLTWANVRVNQPVCTVVGETTAVTTYTTNSVTVLTFNYASTASPIFDYVCIGQ